MRNYDNCHEINVEKGIKSDRLGRGWLIRPLYRLLVRKDIEDPGNARVLLYSTGRTSDKPARIPCFEESSKIYRATYPESSCRGKSGEKKSILKTYKQGLSGTSKTRGARENTNLICIRTKWIKSVSPDSMAFFNANLSSFILSKSCPCLLAFGS